MYLVGPFIYLFRKCIPYIRKSILLYINLNLVSIHFKKPFSLAYNKRICCPYKISGPDVFSRLIPIGAHEASSVYSEEKAKLLRQVTSQVDAKNTELIEFMSSLQLDQLEVLDSDQK